MPTGADGGVDAEALARALYDEHGPALHAWARRRFTDGQVAEEVVQEAVLQAWRHHDQFDPARGTERAWMFGIARNVAASRLRRDRRRLHVVPTAQPDETPGDVDDIARVAERSLVADALRSLSEEHRAVIAAAFFDGLRTGEIGRRLGIPDGTVKSRLHYGLRALRSALEELEAF